MSRLHAVVVAAVTLAIACGGPGPSPPPAPTAASLEAGSFAAEIDGHRIHYEVHGSGPVVMTVPNSWGLSLDGLRELYRPLEEHLTMVYFDPPGMGGSGPAADRSDMGMAAVREDFHALRRQPALDRVNAIGWSNGAMNLILLAAEHPETLESAIFLHGAASFTAEDMQQFSESHPQLMKGWAEMQRELTSDELTDTERTARMKAFWLNEYFPTAMASPKTRGDAMRRVFEPAQFSWAHADYANEEAPEFDARDRLAAITTRCLVIAGAHDMIPVDKAHELADGLPDATLAVFEGSGHFSPIEQPERFQRAVLAFLGVAPAS